MDELIEQTKLSLENKEINSKNFTKQISFNLIPHIDVFSDDGYTKEELKMTNETKKILDSNIELSATCVRVPVLVSHSEAVNLELEKDFTIDQIRECLENMEGCKVIDERKDGGYSTPLEAAGKDETFISRIREDKTKKNCLNMWVVSDNLLRGAAAPLNKLSDTTHIFKQFFFVLSSRILEIKVSSFPAASRGVEYPPSFLSSITLQPSIFSKHSLI